MVLGLKITPLKQNFIFHLLTCFQQEKLKASALYTTSTIANTNNEIASYSITNFLVLSSLIMEKIDDLFGRMTTFLLLHSPESRRCIR